jgi:hypothetical protein
VLDVEGWRLKRYSIVYGPRAFDWAAYDDAWPLVRHALPSPPVAQGRPGVGFVIAHTGRGVHYVVLGWWERENELPVRLFVRGFGPDDRWRSAQPGESFCVWDLQVIAHERDAYVETVLRSPDRPDLEGYLARRLEVSV